VKVSSQHGRHGVVEIDPHLRQIGLLGLAGVRATTRKGRQTSRKEASERLARTTRRVEEIDQYMPLGGRDARLLSELPARRLQGRLTGDISQSGGQLEEVAAHRMTELSDEQDAVVIIDRYDTHRTRVQNDIPDDDGPAGQTHLVAHH
jgi:hypothetical protein